MPLDGLDTFASEGAHLLDGSDAVPTHTAFRHWVDEVHTWLSQNYPNSGLSADWAGQAASRLVVGNAYYDDQHSWSMFRMAVQARLQWLGGLPTRVALLRLAAPARAQNESVATGRKEIKLNTVSRAYVDPDRINALKALQNPAYDLSKLIRLCEELNIAFAGECYLAMIVLTRAIIDHVPPVFDCTAFTQVANSYGGAKSFKEAMLRLDTSSRKIADYYLHTQIRKSESLPTVTQVDFSNDIDFLVAEVTRVLGAA